MTRAYDAHVEPRSADVMPKTEVPGFRVVVESGGTDATMPEKSWPGIVYGW